MKTKIFIIGLLIGFSSVYPSTSMFPKKISKEFLKLYPRVTKSFWDKEGKDYQVEFKKDKTEMSVIFNHKGNVLEKEFVIKNSVLPYGIKKFVSDLYPKYKISKSSIINKSTGETLYETEICKGKIQKDLLFDENSKIIHDEFGYFKAENED